MSCLCGSQKKSTAPSTINPVNIGSLCFLFGVEGVLCAYLDLIPETIKAVLDVNKKPDDVDDIFAKWARKFAKTNYNIVIDEATGDINLTSFCSNPPPPIPEDINFSDIFIFLAEVVKILDIFFKTNDIISGNDTRLIDKITGFWLFKQWYENCECKKCPEPPPEDPPPDNDPPPFDPPVCGACPDGSRDGYIPCKNLRVYSNPSNPLFVFSCFGFWVYTFYRNIISSNPSQQIAAYTETFKYYVPLEVSKAQFEANTSLGVTFYSYSKTVYRNITFDPPQDTTTETANFIEKVKRIGNTEEIEQTLKPVITQNDGAKIPFSGNSDGLLYPPCAPCPPPPPPKEFCDLYPDHPDCIDNDDDDDDGCQTELVLIGEFTECAKLRSPKRLELLTDGDLIDVAVTERPNCESVRSLKVVQLFECEPAPPPPPDPCEGVDCFGQTSGIQSILGSAYGNGEIAATESDAYNYLFSGNFGLDFDCCGSQITSEIQTWVNGFN